MYYTLITASAQTVMARRSKRIFTDPDTRTHIYRHRTYAITRKNKWVSGILYAGATAQFTVGVYIIVYAAVGPRQRFLPHRADTQVSELTEDILARSATRESSVFVSDVFRQYSKGLDDRSDIHLPRLR